jgi:hypothetical protein
MLDERMIDDGYQSQLLSSRFGARIMAARPEAFANEPFFEARSSSDFPMLVKDASCECTPRVTRRLRR